MTTLLAAAVLLPDRLGLDQHSPFVQLVSFRPLLLAGGSVLVVFLAILVGFRRRAWPFAAGLAAVLLVGGALVLPRVLPGPVPTGGTTLTVLSLNVFEGQADVDAIADLIRTELPDLIALPEAGARFSDELAPLIEPLGYRLHHSDTADTRDIANVAAAVGAELGEVQVRTTDQGSSFPYVEVTGGRLGATRFMAYHSAAPLPLDVDQLADRPGRAGALVCGSDPRDRRRRLQRHAGPFRDAGGYGRL